MSYVRSNEGWGSWLGLFFSSTFFTGFIPGFIHSRFKGKGGGLMGSLLALIFLWLMWRDPWWDLRKLAFLSLLIYLSGVLWAIRSGEAFMLRRWGPRQRHTGESVNSDFNETNLDEVAGMFFAALIIWPWSDHASVWRLVATFILFRVFDTKKPWPIYLFEDFGKETGDPVHLASGVMHDDVVAGIMAGLSITVMMLCEWHVKHHSIMM